MDIVIDNINLNGTVRAIPSKSQAHRALICAALADKTTQITCNGESDDIAATVECLSALGTEIQRIQDGYTVQPLDGKLSDLALLPCRESGSTFRFLLPIVGALGYKASFISEGRLPERPLSPLYEELISHGCILSDQGSVPFESVGQLTPGCYTLDGSVSSQFVSGLLFALPLLCGDSELHLTGQIESLPYIELTIAMLKTFGIQLSFNGSVFAIPGNQKYKSPGAVYVEGDWSNAAFWLAAGAVGGGTVTCTGLDLNSKQGDRIICDILNDFGAWVTSHDDEVTVSASSDGLKGIDIDAQNIPDLVPILSVVGAVSEGVTIIKNAGRLRTKESDRLASVSSVLDTLGANIKETEDGLIIHGCARHSRLSSFGFGKRAALKGGTVSSFGDHRIAMAAAIAATICSESVTIQGAEAVNKSYPGFFDEFDNLQK